MLLANATTTHLWLAFARISNPNITTSQFNDWYNNELLPGFMEHKNASLAVRYEFIPFNNSAPQQAPAKKWEYVAVYKTHENATSTPASSVDAWQYVKTPHKRDIGPDDVEIELSTWTPIQTFESPREKSGNVPKGRPKVACVVRIEPEAGPEGEKNVEDWYHYQHLDMLSMLPNYRRSTRYRSLDGSKPRWLAIHEMDSAYVDPYEGSVLMGTELAHRVMDSVVTFDAANWGFIFEKGDLNEKL